MDWTQEDEGDFFILIFRNLTGQDSGFFFNPTKNYFYRHFSRWLSPLWAREGTIINNCRHLAVVKAAQGSIVLKSYLTNFVLRIYRHLEDVGSYIRIYSAE